MSLLTPLFLLGALGVALPVVFHLIRRTTRERTPFSSLMFLLPTPPRITRRSRLEHIFLLLLRCLALCLLAVGFARPFVKQPVSVPPASAAPSRFVLLVDTSASMRRANLWPEAQKRAEAILGKTTPADQAAVFAFDRQLKPLVSFEEWNAAPSGDRVALAMGKLARHPPGWSATRLGDALISAAEALAETGGKTPTPRGRIILITDLQEGSHLEPLQGYEWPKGIELSVERLNSKRTSNAALQLMTDSDEAGARSDANLRVRVSNAADSRRDQFQVGWARPGGGSFAGQPIAIYVPAGQSRIVTLPAPSSAEPVDRIILTGDEEEFDNTVFATPPETARLTVLYLGSDSEKDSKQPLYFLRRAFQETRRQVVQVLAHPPGGPLVDTEVRSATLFIITDPLPDQPLKTIREQLVGGKTALVMLKTDALGPTLARLLELDRVSLEEAQPNGYAMLADIDFRHPLFAPFADPRFSDFTRIHFWKYRRLDPASIPSARVVAKFDSGAPALLEVPVGKGRLLVLTSGWQPDDSQLALSTKFVPLLYSMLEGSGAPASAPTQYYIGDTIPLAPVPGAGPSTLALRLPDGSQMDLASAETNFSQTTMPGIYTVVSAQTSRRFAVNLDPTESRTAPLSPDELERLGAPLARQVPTAAREADRRHRLQNTELESRQKLWRWFVVMTLAVLLFETWLAGRTGRKPAALTGGATL
jgi:hypothetical protein